MVRAHVRLRARVASSERSVFRGRGDYGNWLGKLARRVRVLERGGGRIEGQLGLRLPRLAAWRGSRREAEVVWNAGSDEPVFDRRDELPVRATPRVGEGIDGPASPQQDRPGEATIAPRIVGIFAVATAVRRSDGRRYAHTD